MPSFTGNALENLLDKPLQTIPGAHGNEKALHSQVADLILQRARAGEQNYYKTVRGCGGGGGGVFSVLLRGRPMPFNFYDIQ